METHPGGPATTDLLMLDGIAPVPSKTEEPFLTEIARLADLMRRCYLGSRRVIDRMMKTDGLSFACCRLPHFIRSTPSARTVDIAAALGW